MRSFSKGARRGFVLATAIAVCFVMVLVALTLANQNRALVDAEASSSDEAVQTESALQVYSNLRGFLQDQTDGSFLGFSGPIATVMPGLTPQNSPFQGNVTETQVHFTGKLTYFPVPDPNLVAGIDGYQSSGLPSAGLPSGLPFGYPAMSVQPSHTSATLLETMGMAQPLSPTTNRYFCLYTSNYPYGLLATGQAGTGKLQVNSARSVSTYNVTDAQSNLDNLMVNMFGQASVSVGQLNGRAYSNGPVQRAPGAVGGIAYPNFYGTNAQPVNVTMPKDFAASMTAFTQNFVPPGLTGLGLLTNLDGALKDLDKSLNLDVTPQVTSATALLNQFASQIPLGGLISSELGNPPSGNIPNPADVATINNPWNTDFTPSPAVTGTAGTASRNLNVGISLLIPANDKQQLTFQNITVQHDLIVADNATLLLSGINTLNVTGAIQLGQYATLVVMGDVQAGNLSTTYSLAGTGNGNFAMRSTFICAGKVTINGGMVRCTTTTQQINTPPTATGFTIPAGLQVSWITQVLNTVTHLMQTTGSGSIPPTPQANPVLGAFNNQQLIGMALSPRLDPASGSPGFPGYLVTSSSAQSVTDEVPGMAIMSNSTVTVSPTTPARLSGLIYANGDITLNNQVLMVGAMWSNSSIIASQTDYRYYPYYTHMFAHTPGANLTVGASEQHQISWGKLP